MTDALISSEVFFCQKSFGGSHGVRVMAAAISKLMIETRSLGKD